MIQICVDGNNTIIKIEKIQKKESNIQFERKSVVPTSNPVVSHCPTGWITGGGLDMSVVRVSDE